MNEIEFKYDVAFSFLSEDEKIAETIANELRDRMEIFIYSERQKELAGKDGLESFSRVFQEESRVCAVLYRPNWGNTKWTRVEETAIKNRAFEKGWEFLVFIALESSQIPVWLPNTKIWIGFERFGIQGVTSVIDARFQEAGHEVNIPG